MAEEWGPWIKHDGARPYELSGGQRVQVLWDTRSGTITPAPGSKIDNLYPGWFWRWKRIKTGWFKAELLPVCDDPHYCPIIVYRIRKPRGLIILEGLLEHLPEKVDA